MNSIFRFIANMLTGGILIMLPLILIFVLIGKADTYIMKISEPISKRLPDLFLGFNGSRLLAILLLILICFLFGVAFQSSFIKKWVGKLEENVLCYVPGYSMIKSIIIDAIGADVKNNMTSVLVQEGDGWLLGFLIEENETFCTVFLPGAPKPNLGRVKIVPAGTVKKIDVPTNEVSQSIKNYGKDALTWRGKNK